MRDALVLAALGLPAANGDWQGDLQAGGSMAAAALGGAALKHVFPERRPDGSNRHSFPSGHAAIGEASGFLITKRSARVAILPWGDAHGGGATIAARF